MSKLTSTEHVLRHNKPNTNNKLENIVLAHRYLYYVLAEPIISDNEYDQLESKARSIYPESSPVHKLGSSLPKDYSTEVVQYANRMLTFKEKQNVK